MAKVCVVFIVVYMAVAIFLAQRDGLEGIDIYYFISTTMTTIGLGDISPQSQLNRACAVIVLPYGLVVISKLQMTNIFFVIILFLIITGNVMKAHKIG